MKFLTDFHLAFLDHAISQPLQSIVFEIIFWATAYIAFTSFSAKRIRNLFRKFPIWKRAKERSGVFCGNGQDDAVLSILIMTHHFLAGGLMLFGYSFGDTSLFRHGYLCETGFEIADLVAMMLPLYPYMKYDGVKAEIKGAMIFHHTPGILLASSVIQTGLYKNEHLQTIALALLIGAAVSIFFGEYLYCLDVDKNLRHSTVVVVCNVSFFVFCRWYLFPKHSLLLIQDVQNNMGETLLIEMLYAAGIIFAVFNIAITVDIIPKTLRYIKRCMDGVTLLESEPIPTSRDSMVYQSFKRGSYKGRRSSIVNIVQSWDDVTTTLRRSSLVTVLRLMPLGEIQTFKTEDKVNGSPDITATAENNDSDSSKEDTTSILTAPAAMSKKAQ